MLLAAKVLAATAADLFENPELLALMYDAPILLLLGECDRHPEKEKDIMDMLEGHVRLFYRLFHEESVEGGGEHD